MSTFREAIQPTWSYETNAVTYFQQFRPIMPPIGHSIYVYHLTEEDVARVNPLLEGPAAANRETQSDRLATDIDLREVVVARRSEQDVNLDARPRSNSGRSAPNSVKTG